MKTSKVSIVLLLFIGLSFFLFTGPCATQAFGQNQFHSTSSGAWSDPSIWFCYTCVNGPYIPNGSSDRAEVQDNVNLDVSATVQNLTVAPGGSLSASGTSLSVGPDSSDPQALADFQTLTLSNGASIEVNGAMEVVPVIGTSALTIESGSVLSDSGALSVGTGGLIQLTVSGAGSQWNTQGMLFLADGNLNIQAGGHVTDVNGNLGADGSGTVTVTVDGAGSMWTSSSVLYVGGGNGTLTVQNGGSITSNGGDIGALAGNQGLMTVTGSGSAWNNSGFLYVGDGGKGALNIQNGGTVTSGVAIITTKSGAPGSSVMVDGSNSAWAVNGALTVGQGDAGSLTIQNHSSVVADGALTVGGGSAAGQANGVGVVTVQTAGSFSSDGGTIDNDASAATTSTLVVTGIGSKWTNSGELTVGNAGVGLMTVSVGGVVSNHSATLGAQFGSTGTVIITSGETEWINNGDLTVGENGQGVLTIADGALASSDTGTISAGRTSQASAVTVTDGGSLWDIGSELTVGKAGTGALTIQNGGGVTDAASSQTAEAILGDEAGSGGTVTVTGSGSKWTDGGDLTVGNSGIGSLTISAGGSVTDVEADIGSQLSSVGGVKVAGGGSLWSNTAGLTVGDQGKGDLTIQDEAQVESADGTVGGEATGNGTVSITSAQWNVYGDLTVGDKGHGTLSGISAAITSTGGTIGESAGSVGNVTLGNSSWTIAGDLSVAGESAGTFNLAGATTVSNQEGTIGEESTGAGGVTVGAGSTWTNSGDLTVGGKGQGTLGILQGGKVTDSAGDVGSELNSQGTVTVSGLWQNSGDLTIGDSGSGTMTINGSGSVTNTNGDAASNLGSIGKVTVQGNGSTQSIPTWTNSGSLKVGDGGTGELDVLNGGQVYSESGAIGGAQGSQGTVKVDGAGSKWVANDPGDAGNIQIGTDQGTGKLTVSNGGAVKANNIEVGANGALDGVSGTLISNITVDSGGTVSPGDPGPMNITGNFDLSSGSTLTLEVAGANDYDSLNITGNGTFDGTIDLDFLNGYTPSAGDSFDFISDNGTFAWNPSGVDFMGITPGSYTTNLTGGFGLTATSNWSGGSTPPPSSSTPEPASVILLGTGLLGLGWTVKQKRA